MASITKACRHGSAAWDGCGCAWYVRYQRDGRTIYAKTGTSDRAEAMRVFTIWKDDPPALVEVARAPGLNLPKKQDEPWIYFLTGAHLTKIGMTTDLRKRMGQIQACSPVPLTLMLVVEGDREAERVLHARFDAFRRHGEWFALPIGWENDPGLLEMTKPRHLEVAA